jgi:endonuclease YncB( thermonuclease family)
MIARLGRTPTERAVLLLVAALVAYALGRWTAPAARTPFQRPHGEIPAVVTGVPLVLDGDSLDFGGLRVRLFGIDAFERDQVCVRGDGSRYECGQVAREAMILAVASALVTCEKRDVDQYGRMVAVCSSKNGDLAAILVDGGDALAYRQFSHDYVDEEERARAARRGAWSGRFDAPWDWRHRARR